MGRCSCVKCCCRKNWSELEVSAEVFPLFTEGLIRFQADSAKNLVLAGKHPWSVLVIILQLEWTKDDGDSTWFNLLFQWGSWNNSQLLKQKENIVTFSMLKKIPFSNCVPCCSLTPCTMASYSLASAIIRKKHWIRSSLESMALR